MTTLRGPSTDGLVSVNDVTGLVDNTQLELYSASAVDILNCTRPLLASVKPGDGGDGVMAVVCVLSE